MINWLAANWINILVIALVAVAVFFAARSLIKDKKAGKSSCGCNCSHCAMAGKCHSQHK
ncbi:Virus attachment protein p12 family protein [Ruminococcaceae bacterium YAD3003]|nr:Virus attachment protein p12 family protein [Ruminococcaceae bacterium YAD3003]